MPKEDKKLLKYNSEENFKIYADLEYILSKMHSCQNNPKKSYTEKNTEHIPSGYSWITCCSFDTSENEWHHYREEDCVEKFCKV